MLRVLLFFVFLCNFFPVNHRSAVTSAGQPARGCHQPSSPGVPQLGGAGWASRAAGSAGLCGRGFRSPSRRKAPAGDEAVSVFGLCQAHRKPLVPTQCSDQTLWLLKDASRCFGTSGTLSSHTRRVCGSVFLCMAFTGSGVCRETHPQEATGLWHLATGPGASPATSAARTPH